MKIVLPFDAKNGFTVSRHYRSDLRKQMEKHWLGKTESRIGILYFKFDKGQVIMTSPWSARKDLFLVQWSNVCNAFINHDGSVQIDEWDDVFLDDTEKQAIRQVCYGVLHSSENAKFVEEQRKFLDWIIDSAPLFKVWMPVEEAVKILIEAGF